jgi:hypothetical protein
MDDGLDAFHSAGEFFEAIFDFKHVDLNLFLVERKVINFGLQVCISKLLVFKRIVNLGVLESELFIALS